MILGDKEEIGLNLKDAKEVIFGTGKYSSFISNMDMVATDVPCDVTQEREGVDYSSVNGLWD